MTKAEIIDLFITKHILSGKSNLIRRPWNWRSNFDLEAQDVFKLFAKSYRSEDEAWFCLCRNIELPLCPVCGKKKVIFTGITKNGGCGYNTTCEDCSANQVQCKIDKVKATCSKRTKEQRHAIVKKRKATNKILHGDENYGLFGSDSFKANLEAKYGDCHYNNHEQTVQTNIDRYGVVCNLTIPEVHAKSIEKSWSPEVREKRIANCIEKNGVSCLWCSNDVIQKNLQIKRDNIRKVEDQYDCTMLGDVVKTYGQGFKLLGLEYIRIGSHVYVQNKDIQLIQKYASEGTHTNGYTSKPEKEILQFIKSIYTGKIEENNTSAVKNENHRFFELDIYLPEIKLAIDFNGTYWHSTNFKDKYYHQRKTRCCRNSDINILHIFENDWNENKDTQKDLIKSCIDQSFNNLISINENGIIIGDNSLPIFGKYEIIDITEPQLHKVGNLEYYDSGLILYKNLPSAK